MTKEKGRNLDFEGILDSIEDGIVVVDKDYRIVFINSHLLNSSGAADKSQVLGALCHEILFNSDDLCPWCKCETCFETGKQQSIAVKVPVEEGPDKKYIIHASPYFDGDGAVCRVVELVQDVSGSDELESQLKRLATIADSSADAMMCVDLKGKIDFWNKGATNLFEYEKEEILGRDFHDFIPDELNDEAEGMREEALRLGSVRFETERMKKDGTRVPVDMTLTAIKNEEGKPIGVAGSMKDLSERKQLEDDYKNLFENAKDGISLTDRDGNLVLFNSRFTEMTGYSREELKNRGLSSIIHPRDRRKVLEHYRVRLEGGEAPRVYEFRLLRKDGSILDVEVTASPVLRNDEIIGTQGILRDVTERGKLEAEAREARDHLETIFDTIEEGICVLDKDLRIISFNEAFSRNISTPRKDILGRTCYDVLHKYSEKEFHELCKPKCIVMEAMAKGEPIESMHHHELGGEDIYHESRALPIMNHLGEPYQVVYIINDVTVEKQAELEIRHLKEFNENLLKNTPIGIFSTDSEGRVTSANPALLKILGIPEEDRTIEFNVLTLPSIKEAGWDVKFRKVLAEGEVVEVEGEYISMDGKPSIARVKAIPLKNADGSIIGLIGIAEDITGRKMLERRLLEHATKLEHSNNLKDLFADIMRHDLLNPLGVIKNVIELTEEDLRENVPKKEFDILNRNIAKIEDLVHTAARFGLVESVEQLEFEEMDLREILKEVGITLEAIAAHKNISVSLPEGSYPAQVNAFIEDAFSNLISNSIKYSPPDSEVKVRIVDDGDDWRVEVADQGPGVPDPHKKAIFERFKRVEKGSVKGSGLGLAIVKRVVEIHNGEAWVEDNPDGGSIFILSIPKKRPENV